MLPEPSVLAPFAVAVIVIALTPGPDMTFFLGRALAQGRAAGLAAMAGATTGILVHTLLVALGLSALIVALFTAVAQAAFTVLASVMLARIYVQLAGRGDTEVSVPSSGT